MLRRTTHHPAARADAGFSLLEAMVALAILGFALAAFFQAGALGLRTSQGAEARTQAALELQSLMTRLGHDIPLQPGTLEGATDLGRPYRLAITLAQPPSASGLAAYVVEGEIWLSQARSEQRLHLSTLKTARIAP